MRKIIIIVFIILFLILTGILFFHKDGSVPHTVRHDAVVRFANGTEATVEIADEEKERERGFSFRERPADQEGILFVFDRPDRYSFWMYGMKFPLDFLWIEGGKVVDLTPNVIPDVPPTKTYRPAVPVSRMLEMPAGFIEKSGTSVGDEVEIVHLQRGRVF
ncbi:DUF192 domain-containing protein [Candidatus Uhrbacteria bacterium]|nr:DUF192 domain-containing protein [Candidatus Uhrbacteria bacterium]